jgi:hypothetical protein
MNSLSPTVDRKERKWKVFSVLTMSILITTIAVLLAYPLPNQTMQVLQVSAPEILQTAYGAGSLTNVFAMPAENIFSTKTYYTIAFTTATTGSLKLIEITFPTGFNVGSAKLIQAQNIGGGVLSVSGQTLKYTVSTPISVAAPKAIKIMIGDISNPAFGVNLPPNQVSITTKEISGANQIIIDGPTKSALFTLIQVSSPMVGANAVDSSKIKDGQVTLADLATNAVNSAKIADGSIARVDVSTAFIKRVTLPDANDSVLGHWNPDGEVGNGLFFDPDAKDGTIILVDLDNESNTQNDCHADYRDFSEFVNIQIVCAASINDGATLNYVLIN